MHAKFYYNILIFITGDVISLGQDVRLKFNYPQEASFLREKRRSAGHLSSSMVIFPI